MRAIWRLAPRLLALSVVLGLAACGGEHQAETVGDSADMARVEGAVVYRERMLLPPGAGLEIQLQDISRADADATVLASVLLSPEGAPPYGFAIDYDPARIDPRMRYALRATIYSGDELLFTSTDYIDPFQGNPVEILVQRVPEAVRRAGPGLEDGVWVLDTLAGELASAGAGGKPVDLRFDGAEQRAAGFSGCNRYTGGYVREGVAEQGSPLSFGPLAGTRMACAEGGELEQNYLRLLGVVNAFTLEGDTLTLLAGPEVVATFKSAR